MGWNNHENLKVPVLFLFFIFIFLILGFIFNRERTQYSKITNDQII